jgi:hypothetical protein
VDIVPKKTPTLGIYQKFIHKPREGLERVPPRFIAVGAEKPKYGKAIGSKKAPDLEKPE